jgi:hypothetical protein
MGLLQPILSFGDPAIPRGILKEELIGVGSNWFMIPSSDWSGSVRGDRIAVFVPRRSNKMQIK